MDTYEILQVLDDSDKVEILKLWDNDHPINARFQFIKNVLNDRFIIKAYSWDLYRYNMIFQTICNRLQSFKNKVVHIAYSFVKVVLIFKDD